MIKQNIYGNRWMDLKRRDKKGGRNLCNEPPTTTIVLVARKFYYTKHITAIIGHYPNCPTCSAGTPFSTAASRMAAKSSSDERPAKSWKSTRVGRS